MSELVTWLCNICGIENTTSLQAFGREMPSCHKCQSTSRDRQLAHLVSMTLLKVALPIPDMPVRKDLLGVGLSDSHKLAKPLEQMFSYQNTFFDREPFLDITCVPDDLAGQYDFVISSDVFEHVAPPVSRAFAGAHRLLKTGGRLLLTVPWGNQVATREHFPDLYDYKITQENGEFVLTNRTAGGRVQQFRNLVFHGGPGATLEMRIFSFSDLCAHLDAAGFTDIKVWKEDYMPHGVYQNEPWARPISAVAK